MIRKKFIAFILLVAITTSCHDTLLIQKQDLSRFKPDATAENSSSGSTQVIWPQDDDNPSAAPSAIITSSPNRQTDFQEPSAPYQSITNDVTVRKDISQLVMTEGKVINSRVNPGILAGIGLQSIHHTPDKAPAQWQLEVDFDNDIFTNTDIYFTNGANIRLITPLANGLFKPLLAGLNGASGERMAFSIRQDMFTPTNLDAEGILYGDRPFAGILTLSQERESWSFEKRLYLISRLELGILGPGALAGPVQTIIHGADPPVGWTHQISNTPVINYHINLSHAILSEPWLEVDLNIAASAGTVFNRAVPGVGFRIGRMEQVVPGRISLMTAQRNRLSWYFFSKAETQLVLYDATYQGNIFNHNDDYTITTEQIRHMVPMLHGGVAVFYGPVGLEASIHYTAPTFDGARHFRWGTLTLYTNL